MKISQLTVHTLTSNLKTDPAIIFPHLTTINLLKPWVKKRKANTFIISPDDGWTIMRETSRNSNNHHSVHISNNEHGIMEKNIKTQFKICNCNKNHGFALFTIFCDNNEHCIIRKKPLCIFTKINPLNK